ncbi:MAG TPA: hypothetical protein VGK93_02250 [Candidatus Eisenbacteria bacterium]
MKRLTLVIAALAAIAGLTKLATAGDYHVGRLLICSDCHIAHGSQKHGYGSDADTTWLGPHTTDPPYEKLLRGETVNNACLNCHDGKTDIPDVLGPSPNPPTHGRSAGALNVPNGGAHGYTNTSPYTQGNGHTLWSADAPPGVAAGAPPIGAEGLECSDCHRVHGGKYFRNMLGDVATSTATFIDPSWRSKEVTYEIGAAPSSPTPSTWVLEKAPHNYDNDNVQYLEHAGQDSSMYGAWCGNCHGNFHGGPTAANINDGTDFIRHPTAGVNLASTSAWAVSDPTRRVKMMSQSGAWALTTGVPTDMTPSCFSCHKSHGNENKFGLIFVMSARTGGSAPAGSDPRLIDPVATAMTEEGTGGQYRDLCRNCHGMGSWPAGNPTSILP